MWSRNDENINILCVKHSLIKIYFERSGNWTAASCCCAALCWFNLFMDNDFMFFFL